MLRKKTTGEKPTPSAPDPSCSRDNKDDSPAEEGEGNKENNEEAGERSVKRTCRNCKAILRAGNDDDLCSACRRSENDNMKKPFIPRNPNQKF